MRASWDPGGSGLFAPNAQAIGSVRCLLTSSATPERLIADSTTTADQVLIESAAIAESIVQGAGTVIGTGLGTLLPLLMGGIFLFAVLNRR